MATAQTPQTEQEELVSHVAEAVWSEGDLDVVDDVMTDGYVAHLPGMDPVHGPDAYREAVRRYREAFPDLRVEMTEMFSDDDHVAAQYVVTGTHDGPPEDGSMTVPATGQSVEYDGIVVVRFEDGTPVEETNRSDSLRMLEQLGLLG